MRTFRPPRDQCLSELVEPCAEATWRARGEFLRGGTNSSNPSPSSGESVANSVIAKAGPRLLSAVGTSGFAIRMLAPHSDDVRTVAPPSTPTGRVSMCPAELRPRGWGSPQHRGSSVPRGEAAVGCSSANRRSRPDAVIDPARAGNDRRRDYWDDCLALWLLGHQR